MYRKAVSLPCAAAAGLALAACGGSDGGKIQRVDVLQRCLGDQQLPTNATERARLPGVEQTAELLDTELASPSAARLYVFPSVGEAMSAEVVVAAGSSSSLFERRDNVVILYEQQPTAKDRELLDGCFSGDISSGPAKP